MLYKDEAYALDDESLGHIAKLIYLGVFYRNVDHSTGKAAVSMRQMIEFTRYVPAPGSSDASIFTTRQNIRTALKKLEAAGLIELVSQGERNRKMPVYFMPLTWRRKQKQQQPNESRVNTGESGSKLTQHQPNSNPKQQPNSNQVESQVNKGFKENEQPQQQPNITPQQQPPIYISNNTLSIDAREKNLSADVRQTIEGNSRIPSKDQVIDYFLLSSGTEEQATNFFYHYESRNWSSPRAGAIQNWKPLALKWIHNDAMENLKQPNQQIGISNVKPKSNQQNIFDYAEHHSKQNYGEWYEEQ